MGVCGGVDFHGSTFAQIWIFSGSELPRPETMLHSKALSWVWPSNAYALV